MNTAAIIGYDALTPYGLGTEALWDGLLSGRTAIRPCADFNTAAFRCKLAACVSLPPQSANRSRVMRMLTELLSARPANCPADAALLVATTTGEIDRVERLALQGSAVVEGTLPTMLPEIRALTGARGSAAILSAACASSTAALARSLMLIRSGAAEAVLIVAVDGLSEFLFSGFSTIMALDEAPARPFDRNRAGLSLGEGAAYLLVMNGERAAREGHVVHGWLKGAGLTNDANHMTGPSRDGAALARAMRHALQDAGERPDAVALAAAHGTGTRYNDATEMKALSSVFNSPIPTFSIKGGTGHTMGNAGLLQTVVALEALRRGCTPPNLGMQEADDDARDWVSSAPQTITGSLGLVVNAGFGGINAAVLLNGKRETD